MGSHPLERELEHSENARTGNRQYVPVICFLHILAWLDQADYAILDRILYELEYVRLGNYE